MAMVIRVRFKRAAKLYDFDPNGLELHNGMSVVTETARGVELGECMSGVMDVPDERLVLPLKPILRIATEQDLAMQKRNEQAEKEAFDIAIDRIAEHKLEMKLVDVEYVKEGQDYFLRTYIDKPGGITIDDCVAVSREMNVLLDELDYVEGAYTFEVSSPGLGRPLKKARDFERSLGQEVEIRTYKAIDGSKEFYGILHAYDDDSVTVLSEDDEEVTFNKSDMALIRLAFDF